MPDVQGRCPACGGTSLFLAQGGYVTCSRLDCPAPGEADDLLHGRDSVYAIGQALGGDRASRFIAYALAAHERSLSDLRRMTDEQFRAIPGIGDESLARIRAAIPAPEPAPAGAEGAEAAKTTRVFAALHQSAEQDVTRVIDLYEQWVKAGPPPLGVLINRWWDARLAELHNAILPRTGKDAP